MAMDSLSNVVTKDILDYINRKKKNKQMKNDKAGAHDVRPSLLCRIVCEADIFLKNKKTLRAAFPTKHSRIIADCRDGHWPSFAFQINLLKPM